MWRGRRRRAENSQRCCPPHGTTSAHATRRAEDRRGGVARGSAGARGEERPRVERRRGVYTDFFVIFILQTVRRRGHVAWRGVASSSGSHRSPTPRTAHPSPATARHKPQHTAAHRTQTTAPPLQPHEIRINDARRACRGHALAHSTSCTSWLAASGFAKSSARYLRWSSVRTPSE